MSHVLTHCGLCQRPLPSLISLVPLSWLHDRYVQEPHRSQWQMSLQMQTAADPSFPGVNLANMTGHAASQVGTAVSTEWPHPLSECSQTQQDTDGGKSG